MPKYEVTDPTSGRTLELEGDSPPSEQELESIFSSYKDAPKQQESRGVFDALTTKDLGDAPLWDISAQAARLGQFANKGNQQLAEGLVDATSTLPAPLRYAGIAAGGALGTASEFLLPQNRLGALGYAVAPAMRGYQAVRGAFSSTSAKPGIVAQMGNARSKVPAGDIQQAINDPSVFSAPSVQEANAGYGRTVGPVQGATQSLGSKLDKTILAEGDYVEAINRSGRIMNGTEMVADATGNQVPVQMDPQSALEGIQSINRFLKNKAFTQKLDQPQLAEIYQLKDGLMTWMESNGTPGMREAAGLVRKAHVRENLSGIIPQNKYGGNDALRTMWAGSEMASAGALALSGHPLAAIPVAGWAATASPALWGGGIRNYHSASNPNTMRFFGNALTGYQNIEK